jgi:hypothetical protein
MNLAESAISLIDVTIPTGTKVSNIIKLEPGVYPVGIFYPALTTSTALNFNTSADGGTTLVEVSTLAGTPLAVPASATTAGYISFSPIYIDILQIKVADNQTGSKVFKLAVKGC